MENFPIPAPAFDGASRQVGVGNAFDWLRQGWALFIVNPGVWLAIMVLLIVIMLGLAIVPGIGHLATHLLTPILAAGMLLGCDKVARGETLEVTDLFGGFQRNSGGLVMLGVLYLLAMLAVLVLGFLFAGGSVAGGLLMHGPLGTGIAVGGIFLAVLISLVLLVPVLMAIWFAPALVVFNQLQPIDALKASFHASLRNTLPLLVYA